MNNIGEIKIMTEIKNWKEFTDDLLNAVNRVAFYCKKPEMILNLPLNEIFRLRDELDKKSLKFNKELENFINGEIK